LTHDFERAMRECVNCEVPWEATTHAGCGGHEVRHNYCQQSDALTVLTSGFWLPGIKRNSELFAHVELFAQGHESKRKPEKRPKTETSEPDPDRTGSSVNDTYMSNLAGVSSNFVFPHYKHLK
jgi:hypothetical protein